MVGSYLSTKFVINLANGFREKNFLQTDNDGTPRQDNSSATSVKIN